MLCAEELLNRFYKTIINCICTATVRLTETARIRNEIVDTVRIINLSIEEFFNTWIVEFLSLPYCVYLHNFVLIFVCLSAM